MSFLKVIAASFLFSSAAFAADVTTLNCKLEKYPQEQISFKMVNLGKPGMDFVTESEDDYSPVFSTQSKNATIVRLVDTLNGQGGDLRVQSDKIVFFGDAAGIDFAYLVLYKNSKYTQGFVRIEFDFGNDKQYSKLQCSLK